MKTRYFGLAACGVLLFSTMLNAETITIGKGKGVVWEGFNFAGTWHPATGDTPVEYRNPAAGIRIEGGTCLTDSQLVEIDGVKAIPIRDKKGDLTGLGLAPRITTTASYLLRDGSRENFTGTIGYPATRAFINGVETFSGMMHGRYNWCLQPRNTMPENYYHSYSSGTRNSVSASGSWVLITDGSQKSTGPGETHRVPYNIAFSSALGGTAIVGTIVLPRIIDIRVSTLECSTDMITNIAFGAVESNTTENAELSKVTRDLKVSCTQDAGDTIATSINVQFRPISGLYNGHVNKLALDQGGGYITGTIPGKTTVGLCSAGASGGIEFNNKQIPIGTISETQLSQTYTLPIEWRLCSGGASLPAGKFSASAEMLVTYN